MMKLSCEVFTGQFLWIQPMSKILTIKHLFYIINERQFICPTTE